MDARKLKTRSKRLSWLLRHGAGEVGLDMDSAGWVSIEEVLAHERIDRRTLELIVRSNTKNRIQLRGERVRACQGHSTVGMPITLEGLESSWALYDRGPHVWHGTLLTALPSIRREGIVAQSRTHVHMAKDPSSKVGKRSMVQAVLAVSVDRMKQADRSLWEAPNGVILARWVPPECIDGALPVGQKAQSRASAHNGPFVWLQTQAS